MRSQKKLLLSIVVLGLVTSGVAAQPHSDYPEAGKKCPDISFTNLSHFSTRAASLNDFRGKWLILDFWNHHCINCMKSFPKLDELQKLYRGQIQFLLVGSSLAKDGKLYERLYQRYSMSIPCAYDSTLFSRFGIDGVPHIVIIDPDRVVYAVTTTQSLDSLSLLKLINNKKPYFEPKLNAFEKLKLTGLQKDSLALATKDEKLLFESTLRLWKKGDPIKIVTNIDQFIDQGYYKTSAVSLHWLYNIAYIGRGYWDFSDSLYAKFWGKPIIEESIYNENQYSYFLKIPTSLVSKQLLQQAMQYDLKKFFGYDVSIETRAMPCWKLVPTASGKKALTTHSDVPSAKVSYDQLILFNQPVSELLRIISAYNPTAPVFMDATLMKENIDITLNAILSDLPEVKKSLRQNGLDLIESTTEMKVLILKSPLPRRGFR